MLLAEIHGKRFPEVEGSEDYLTSAVFGHLRLIPPNVFWERLFQRAKNVSDPPVSLADDSKYMGVEFQRFTNLSVDFWKNCSHYGEPDLLLRFTGAGVRSLIVLIEVKLDSTKSGVREDDQLKKYLSLLDDRAALREWMSDDDLRYVVYLTRSFAKVELQESIAASGKLDAERRMFGLDWRDVLEVAEREADGGTLLREVAEFLRIRGFEAFRGFHRTQLPIQTAASFYGQGYFLSTKKPSWPQGDLHGRFYGR